MKNSHTTHFGFQTIPVEEKTQRVAEVFNSVAVRYDVMNDLMSLGLHRYWKKTLIEIAQIKPQDKILDIAGGTGDLTKGFLKKIGSKGEIYLADINFNMLSVGRDKFIDTLGITSSSKLSQLYFVQADAQQLPFKENYFDKISMGFGLRNVTEKEKALDMLYRVLKPGGTLFVLEFSKPVLPLLEKIYDKYSFSVLPKLGALITGSEESYQYLVESIRKHPDQESLKKMMLDAGFDLCEYTNLTGGIVSIHKAIKL
jgi:demethylmenaquinone methyltransferase/2-methoxy-6-polyprenyl-1,4-benzoquinol methylase